MAVQMLAGMMRGGAAKGAGGAGGAGGAASKAAATPKPQPSPAPQANGKKPGAEGSGTPQDFGHGQQASSQPTPKQQGGGGMSGVDKALTVAGIAIPGVQMVKDIKDAVAPPQPDPVIKKSSGN